MFIALSNENLTFLAYLENMKKVINIVGML